MARALVCGVAILLALAVPLRAQQETIAAIQVHGNTLTANEEVLSLSGIKTGEPFSESVRAGAEARLRSSRRFHAVDVLKRYASLSDPTQIIVVIQVDDGPVRIDPPIPDGPGRLPAPGRKPAIARRGRVNVMFAPILAAEDGYGFTYGARVAFTGYRDTARRLVVPLSWGGDKRAGIELHQDLQRRWLPDVRAGAFVQRRTHPFFDANADRKRIWARGDWAVSRRIRAGFESAWQGSTLAGGHDEAKSAGADVVFDTRVDPLMPRNAIYARAAVEKLHFTSASIVRTDIDANGYVGLYRGMVLALRAIREDAAEPLPAFYKAVLGGSSNLRGFRAGYAIGDTLVAGSAEIRMPMTSALHVAQIGTSVFIDAGTAYDKGQRLADQHMKRGIGGGVWVTAPLFRLSLMVARGLGSGTRVHLSADLTF